MSAAVFAWFKVTVHPKPVVKEVYRFFTSVKVFMDYQENKVFKVKVLNAKVPVVTVYYYI